MANVPVMRAVLLVWLASVLTVDFISPVAAENGRHDDWGAWNYSIRVTPELRVYLEEPRYQQQMNVQEGADFQPSIAFEPRFSYRFPGGDDSLVFRGFGRYDPEDDDRSHGDIREAYWLHEGDWWDFVVGVNRVFWGVADSRNVVDVINQTDLVEDALGDEKLGQPMVNANFFGEWGELNLFALPLFRPRTHPDEDGRLRGPLPIDDNRRSIDGSGDEARVDFAARYENNLGPLDIGVSHFYGISRAPQSTVAFNTTVPGLGAVVNGLLGTPAGRAVIAAGCTPVCGAPFSSGQFVLAEHYDLINQTSLDVSGVFGDWIIKFEGALINGHDDETIFAAVGGVEYTIYQVAGTDAEIAFLGEFAYDDRDDHRAPQILQDNDVFIGTRIALNDVDNTQFEGGALIDVEHAETMMSFDLSRRLNSHMTAELEGRFFIDPEAQQLRLFDFISHDSYLTAKLSFFF